MDVREVDHKESWTSKNWCFWTVVMEKTLESPLGCKEVQPVHPKGNQSWIFIGRTDVEAETPILWPPGEKNWFIWKDCDARKDWRCEEMGWQRIRWLHGITNSMDMSVSKLWEMVKDRKAWHAAVQGLQRAEHTWVNNNSNNNQSLIIQSLTGILFIPCFFILAIIKLLWIFMNKCMCVSCFLDIHLEVEFPGYMINLCLTFLKTVFQSSCTI